MITIVNANIHPNKPISLNIPTQKLVVISGESISAISSFVNDIIFKEAEYRYQLSKGNINKRLLAKNQTSNVQFVSGLPVAIQIVEYNKIVNRIETLIESNMRGVLYILKNPSAGLNTSEINDLIRNLHLLKNNGNSIIVVDQNIQLTKNSEYIIELKLSSEESKVLFQGKLADVVNAKGSKLAEKIRADKTELIEITSNVFDLYNPIILKGVKTNNLKTIDIEIPVNRITTVVGVSGSGKSSLVFSTLNEISQKLLNTNSLSESSDVSDLKFSDQLDFHSGILPTVEFTNYKPGKTDTVGSISGVYLNLSRLFSFIHNIAASNFSFQSNKAACPKCKAESTSCKYCKGSGILPDMLSYKVVGMNIQEICSVQIDTLLMEFRKQVVVHEAFSKNVQIQRAAQILAGSIINGLDILDKVGLGYLTLSRKATSLSVGEVQRTLLAAGMGQDISGVCFILNEPTLGLHPKDLDNLFFMLYELKRQGNTIVVCENNPGFIRYSDNVIELGPDSGKSGGKIIEQGEVKHLLKSETSKMAKYLDGEYSLKRSIREPNSNNTIAIKNAHAYNLKNINVNIPCNALVIISGVSGSGKSSLMYDVIYQSYLAKKAHNCSKISGFDHFKKIVLVEQNSKLSPLNNDKDNWQRHKLIQILDKKHQKPTLFLLDEPTASLHMQDVELLLVLFDTIIDNGHSIIAISNHKILIDGADYLIELGPEGGEAGGQIV